MNTTTIEKQDITEAIKTIYRELRDRHINPSGEFDKQGRWYADNSDLINVRTPSRAWPYSEMVACRTKKYVTAVAEKFNCKTVDDLRRHV